MSFQCVSCLKDFNLEKDLLQHNAGCTKRRQQIKNFYTKDLLINEYIINNKTIEEIVNLTNFCSVISIKKLLKHFGIEKRHLIKCEYCGVGFENEKSKSGHLARCDSFSLAKKTFQKAFLTSDFLKEEYINKQRSILDIIEEYPLSGGYREISQLLKKYNIEKRTISEAKLTKFTNQKTKLTNIARHGSPHNFCKQHPSRINWEKELFENEGIINVFQRREVIDKIAIKISEYKSDPRHGSRISSLHRKVNEFLVCKGIETKLEFRIENYYYDIFVKPNFIIEVNGNMFHANPEIYKSGDLLTNHIFNNKLVDEIWERDKIKNECAIKNNYKIICLWENEIKNNFDFVENKILKFLECKK